MFRPIGTHQYSQKLLKKIIKIERFLNSDIESGIQDTTISMHFLEVLKCMYDYLLVCILVCMIIHSHYVSMIPFHWLPSLYKHYCK